MHSSALQQTGYASVNGLRMYYEIHGPTNPGQVPLMLLHGGGDTIETSFGHLLPVLAADRRIILPGTEHMAIPSRTSVLVPMVERFLDNEESGPQDK
jgi:hypothetical protein